MCKSKQQSCVITSQFSLERPQVEILRLTPARFLVLAGVLAPHSLEVRRANRAVSCKHAVELLEVVHHDRSSVRVTAERLSRVRVKWTGSIQVGHTQRRHGCRCEVALPEHWNGDIRGIETRQRRWVIRRGVLVARAHLPNIASFVGSLRPCQL